MFILKINFLRNVRKISFKISLKISFKISRILLLSWRISLKTRFSHIFYILN